jgi:hypothetical protein
MQFPMTITDKPELNRLIRDIAREVAKEIVPENKKPFMSKQDCYREAKSRTLVDRAIENRSLKLRTKEGRVGIPRKEFDFWIHKTQ